MDTDKVWIALLDEDEDDFLFWQYGFQTWGGERELKWFKTAESFLSETATWHNPIALILDGVVPPGEEAAWLTKLLANECCQNTAIFMLTGQFKEDDRKVYLEIGATDYLIKPTNSDELQQVVLTVLGLQTATPTELE